MHLDTYADYLRQVEPRTESRAVRSTTNNGWSSNKEISRALRGSLCTLSSDAERGWNKYLH